MKIRIIRFGIHRTSMIFAFVFFLSCLLFAVPWTMLWAFRTGNAAQALTTGLLAPIFCLPLGYLYTAVVCTLYNWLGPELGAIEFTSQEVRQSSHRTAAEVI